MFGKIAWRNSKNVKKMHNLLGERWAPSLTWRSRGPPCRSSRREVPCNSSMRRVAPCTSRKRRGAPWGGAAAEQKEGGVKGEQ